MNEDREASIRKPLACDERGTGAGPAIVFIHGFPHTRALWSGQLEALSVTNRCISPDLRGFGESKFDDPTSWSIDQHADDIAALILSLGEERAVILGLSMGGYIALAVMRRHPELVRALVLADTRAGPDGEEGKQKRNENIQLVREKGTTALADVSIEGMLGKTTRATHPELVTAVHAMLASADANGVIAALEAMRDRADSTPLLAEISVPTLIIVGDEDVLTPPKEARAMHVAIPGSELVVIREAGHLSNLEHPAEFNAIVGNFLRENASNEVP